MAPRDLNDPPSLEPALNAGGPQVEHIDNNNLNNPNNPQGFTDIATASGQKTGADQSGGNAGSAPANPTVKVTGDLTNETSVTPETELMDALFAIDPKFTDYDFTRVDGSTVDFHMPVKGDLNLIAKKKAGTSSSSGTQSSTGTSGSGR